MPGIGFYNKKALLISARGPVFHESCCRGIEMHLASRIETWVMKPLSDSCLKLSKSLFQIASTAPGEITYVSITPVLLRPVWTYVVSDCTLYLNTS